MCYARRQRSSWARIKLSNICISSTLVLSIVIRAFFLASFTFVWVYITLWRECISHFALLCTSLLVVQFSMTVPPALADSLTIISHLSILVKHFLKKFLLFCRFVTNYNLAPPKALAIGQVHHDRSSFHYLPSSPTNTHPFSMSSVTFVFIYPFYYEV